MTQQQEPMARSPGGPQTKSHLGFKPSWLKCSEEGKGICRSSQERGNVEGTVSGCALIVINR
jgi:hypothetical protein